MARIECRDNFYFSGGASYGLGTSGWRATAPRILWQLQIKRVDLLAAYIPRHQRRIIRS